MYKKIGSRIVKELFTLDGVMQLCNYESFFLSLGSKFVAILGTEIPHFESKILSTDILKRLGVGVKNLYYFYTAFIPKFSEELLGRIAIGYYDEVISDISVKLEKDNSEAGPAGNTIILGDYIVYNVQNFYGYEDVECSEE